MAHKPLWMALAAMILVQGCQDIGYAQNLAGRHEPIVEYTDNQYVNAIIGEAEGEGYQGMLGVACAIRNRHTLHGVYGLHAKRVIQHKYSVMTYNLAVKAWYESALHDVTNGAQYWEGTKFKKPYWAYSMRETVKIGNQIFYRKD